MNETAAIVGLYGAVDEAVRENAERREAVARLLPQYRHEDFGWFQEFRNWLAASRDEGTEPSEEFPGLQDGLKRLSAIQPKCRMRPRRLFAIAVAARAFPDMLNPETDLGTLSIEALGVKGLAPDGDRAHELLQLLGNDERLDEAGRTQPNLKQWWDEFVDTAHAHRLLSDVTGMRPRPCSGRVVKLPNDRGLAAAFITEFTTSEVSFEQAVKFLNPAVWKKCRPDFWCEMKSLGAPVKGGAYRYKEVVSSDCDQRALAWFNAETELDFVFWTLPKKATPEVAITNYRLAQGLPHDGELIQVDEGTLVVAKTEGGQGPLQITTTKRIQFDEGFSAPMLALIMCAFGYADTAGDLLCCAASNVEAAAKGKKVGADFPSIEPSLQASGTKGQRASRPASTAPKPAAAPSAASAGNLAEMFQNSANMWASFLRGSAKALERSAKELPSDRKEP